MSEAHSPLALALQHLALGHDLTADEAAAPMKVPPAKSSTPHCASKPFPQIM